MTITVKNNSDGTYTVSCANESTIVGSPSTGSSYPPLSTSGGGVATHIIDVSKGHLPGKLVSGADDIIADLTKRAPGSQGSTRVLEYALRGQHTIDIGEITKALHQHHGPEAGIRIFVEN